MKRLGVIILTALLLVGCGADKGKTTDTSSIADAVEVQNTQVESEKTEMAQETEAQEKETQEKEKAEKETQEIEIQETEKAQVEEVDPCANGHDFSEATCTKDGVCSRCGKVNEKALSHKPAARVCLVDNVCTRCGEVVEAARDHEFSPATCTLPATCKVCQITQGEPLGHDYQSSQWRQYITYTCSRCYDTYQELYLTDEVLQQYATRVIDLVNVERANNGLGALSMDQGLMNVAKLRANECATSFSHTRPNGADCFSAFSECGVSYSFAAENIAAGQYSPEVVVDSWMNSPGHRANILDPNLNKIGVGAVYVDSGYGIYWSQNFTN